MTCRTIWYFLVLSQVGITLTKVIQYDNTQLPELKLEIVKSYFNLIRWSPKKHVQLKLRLPYQAILHIMGDDYLKMAEDMPMIRNMLEDFSHLFTKAGDKKSMLIVANHDFYSYTYQYLKLVVHTKETESNYSNSTTSCFYDNSFDRFNKPDYKRMDKQLLQFIKGGLHKKLDTSAFKPVLTAKNLKQLGQKVKKLTKKKIDATLEEIFNFGSRRFFQPSSTADGCQELVPEVEALGALERHLLLQRHRSKSDPCPKSILQYSIITLEHALKFIEYISKDEETIREILLDNKTVSNLKSEIEEMVKKTIDVTPFAILSLPTIRKIVLGEVKIKEVCIKCNCFIASTREKFMSSIRKIRQVIPRFFDEYGPIECKNIYTDIVRSDIGNADPFSLDFLEKHKALFIFLKDIPNIEAITEIVDYSSRNNMYLWRAYTGLPLNFVSMKHGLKWFSSFFFDIECDRLVQLQNVILVMEKYAERVYQTQMNFLNRCGIMEISDPVDSFYFTDKIMNTELYKMFRDFDYYDIMELLEKETIPSDNQYEMMMYFLFQSINTELDMYHNGLEDAKASFDLTLGSNLDARQLLISALIADVCMDCDFLRRSTVVQADLNKFSYLNYMENRLEPFSYEGEFYESSYVKPLITTQPAIECKENEEELFVRLKDHFLLIYKSGVMRDLDAFKSYTSYIMNEDMRITRKQVLQSVENMTMKNFNDGIFMRLTKSGIENHDDRSIYNDFSQFEERYIGKKGKAPKQFKKLWELFIRDRTCLLQYKGILNYEEIESATRKPISTECDSPKKIKNRNKNKNKKNGKNKKKKKSYNANSKNRQ